MAIPVIIGCLIVAMTSPGAPPQSPAPSMACSLLTASDIESAAGAKPDGDPHPGQYSVPGSDQVVQMCTWVVRAVKGQVVVSAARMPAAASASALAKNNAGMDALRAQHWNEESKDFGNAWCTIMTPPASVKEVLLMSSCTAGPKGTLLSVVFTSPTRRLTMDQAKALLDKATARLP